MTTTIEQALQDVPVHPAAKMLPMMSKAEIKQLAEDIGENGMHEPIWFYTDDAGNTSVLDGRNRIEALQLLGIHAVNDIQPGTAHAPVANYLDDHSGVDVNTFVLSLNVRRRHLTSDQKRKVIKVYIKALPTSKDREVARALGVSPTIVGEVRKEIGASSAQNGQKIPSHKPAERATEMITAAPELAELSQAKGAEATGVSVSVFGRVVKELREAGVIATPEPAEPKSTVDLTPEEQAEADSKAAAAELKKAQAAADRKAASDAKKAQAAEKRTSKLINGIGVQIASLGTDAASLAKLTLTDEQCSIVIAKVGLLRQVSLDLQAAAKHSEE